MDVLKKLFIRQTPAFTFVSDARPSLFAYPSPMKPPAEKAVEKVATAILSTTVKAKAREKTKEKEKAAAESDSMETVRHLLCSFL
jgi:26S proteasome regulatory subunit N2